MKRSHAQPKGRHYPKVWGYFCSWCAANGIGDPLAADHRDLCRYFSHKPMAPPTIRQHLCAIDHYFLEAGNRLPLTRHQDVLDLKDRLVREQRGRHRVPKLGLHHEQANRIIRLCLAEVRELEGKQHTVAEKIKYLQGRRDAAMFAVPQDLKTTSQGLTALKVSDLSNNRVDFGIRSRTLVLEWLKAAQIVSGPIFRGITGGGKVRDTVMSVENAVRICKTRCAQIGLSPKAFAGISLSRGVKHGEQVA